MTSQYFYFRSLSYYEGFPLGLTIFWMLMKAVDLHWNHNSQWLCILMIFLIYFFLMTFLILFMQGHLTKNFSFACFFLLVCNPSNEINFCRLRRQVKSGIFFGLIFLFFHLGMPYWNPLDFGSQREEIRGQICSL